MDGLASALATGASVDARDKLMRTPLHFAVMRGHAEVTRMLLAAGADIEAQNNHTRRPLWFAVEKDDVNMARLLLDSRASIHARGDKDKTPLHWAVDEDSKKVAELLVESRANLDARTIHGHTPLHCSGIWRRLEVARVLLRAGADLDAKCNSGEKVEDMVSLRRGGTVSFNRLLRKTRFRRQRASCLAFAMGQHQRLGADSPVQLLEPGLVHLIVAHVHIWHSLPRAK